MAVSEKKLNEAREVLKEGGYFVYQLEPGRFYNQSIFKWSLFNKSGFRMKGFGHAVASALKEKGELARSDGFRSSTRSEYKLKELVA